jgi:hypothetical protein
MCFKYQALYSSLNEMSTALLEDPENYSGMVVP